MKATILKKKSVNEVSILAKYKDLDNQIKALTSQKDDIKSEILSTMDSKGVNELLIGTDKAVRKEITQERIDSKLVREVLSPDDLVRVTVSSTQVRLTVI